MRRTERRVHPAPKALRAALCPGFTPLSAHPGNKTQLFPRLPLISHEADGMMGPSCAQGPPSELLSRNHPIIRAPRQQNAAFPPIAAHLARGGRNNGSILRPRPSERPFVRESPHYPRAEATKRSFALDCRSSSTRRTERWVHPAPKALRRKN